MEGPRKSGSSRALVRLLLIAVLVGGLIAAAASFSPAGLSDWDEAGILPLAIILVLMTARLTSSTRPLGPMARNLAVFLAFGVVLVIGYSYRDDFSRIYDKALGEVIPGRGVEIAPGIMRFEMDDSGQFAIDAKVDGVAVHFLMDTGASGVVLSRRDASRLGLNLKDLRYTGLFTTATGLFAPPPLS